MKTFKETLQGICFLVMVSLPLLLIGCGGDGGSVTPSKGESWTSRDSGTKAFLHKVTYGNGTFVAVGYYYIAVPAYYSVTDPATSTLLSQETTGNRILTSPDGLRWTVREWTARDMGSFDELIAVAYGNGTFVAVGSSGTIMTSPDGCMWTVRRPAGNVLLNNVAYGNGTFVVVGYRGTIMTSPDGVEWTDRISGSPDDLQGVTYGNGKFVVVGNAAFSSPSLTSPDGVTWAFRPGRFAMGGMKRVTYGNGIFVAVGDSGILISSDGIEWSYNVKGGGNSLQDVTYGNGVFVAAGFYGIVTSPDGVTWTYRRHSDTGSSSLYGVTYGNDTFIAVGGSGKILQSTL